LVKVVYNLYVHCNDGHPGFCKDDECSFIIIKPRVFQSSCIESFRLHAFQLSRIPAFNVPAFRPSGVSVIMQFGL